MKDMYPQLNLVAFIFECTKGWGQLWGSFVENTLDAGSYQGELLGLMAIHLIIWAINKVTPGLRGLVHILLECLGALCKVENLPPYWIPTQCNHSDILKNIIANCSDPPFTQIFSQVKAHQDDSKSTGTLPMSHNSTVRWIIWQSQQSMQPQTLNLIRPSVSPWNLSASYFGTIRSHCG